MRHIILILATFSLTGCFQQSLTKAQVDEQVKGCHDNGAIGAVYWVGASSDEVKSIDCVFTLPATNDKTYTRPATEFVKHGE